MLLNIVPKAFAITIAPIAPYLTYAFIPSFILSFVHSFIRSFLCSFIHSWATAVLKRALDRCCFDVWIYPFAFSRGFRQELQVLAFEEVSAFPA